MHIAAIWSQSSPPTTTLKRLINISFFPNLNLPNLNVSLKGHHVSVTAVSHHSSMIIDVTCNYFRAVMCVEWHLARFLSAPFLCMNVASKADEDKEVLCSPPTVPAFWDSGFRTMGLKTLRGRELTKGHGDYYAVKVCHSQLGGGEKIRAEEGEAERVGTAPRVLRAVPSGRYKSDVGSRVP